MKPNNIVSGSSADILAYGFSGNSPYHFSSKYLMPCAIKIANGKMQKTTASGLNPVITKQNNSKIEAMELREAKNPFVVENNPINAKAKVGKLINGERNTPSTLEYQENTGVSPEVILEKKLPNWKYLAVNNSEIVSG